MSPPERPSVPSSGSPIVGEAPPAVVERARAALAALVGADSAAAADLVVAEAVTWPDGSLGCPEPGMYYTQQEVAGYHLVFDVSGTTYDFRASEGGELRRCDGGGPRSS